MNTIDMEAWVCKKCGSSFQQEEIDRAIRENSIECTYCKTIYTVKKKGELINLYRNETDYPVDESPDPKRKSFSITALPIKEDCETYAGSFCINKQIGIDCVYPDKPALVIDAKKGTWNTKIRYIWRDWSKRDPEMEQELLDDGYDRDYIELMYQRLSHMKFHDVAAILVYHSDVDPTDIDWSDDSLKCHDVFIESANVVIYDNEHWNARPKFPHYDWKNGEKHALFDNGIICTSMQSDGVYECRLIERDGIVVAVLIIFDDDAVHSMQNVVIHGFE